MIICWTESVASIWFTEANEIRDINSGRNGLLSLMIYSSRTRGLSLADFMLGQFHERESGILYLHQAEKNLAMKEHV